MRRFLRPAVVLAAVALLAPPRAHADGRPVDAFDAATAFQVARDHVDAARGALARAQAGSPTEAAWREARACVARAEATVLDARRVLDEGYRNRSVGERLYPMLVKSLAQEWR